MVCVYVCVCGGVIDVIYLFYPHLPLKTVFVVVFSCIVGGMVAEWVAL